MFKATLFADALWTIHYALLGGISPLISGLVSFFRTWLGVFIFPGQKKIIALLGFLAILVLCLVFNNAGAIGYLPILAGFVFSLVVVFNENYLISRLLIICGMLTWTAIGLAYGSIGEVISSLISVSSILIGMVRHARQDRAKPPSPKPEILAEK